MISLKSCPLLCLNEYYCDHLIRIHRTSICFLKLKSEFPKECLGGSIGLVSAFGLDHDLRVLRSSPMLCSLLSQESVSPSASLPVQTNKKIFKKNLSPLPRQLLMVFWHLSLLTFKSQFTTKQIFGYGISVYIYGRRKLKTGLL